MTIEQIFKDYTQQLQCIYDAREAAYITDWVFESVAGIKRLDRITNAKKELDSSITERLNNKLSGLLLHKPVQYVLEEAWFYKMKFFVNKNVLIPRPETEELIEWVVTQLKREKGKLKIIDIGTGCGCIAIALKKELPDADVLAIDVSAEALSVARQNALDLTSNIKFLQINFLDEAEWHKLSSFDIIVSNPPYIPEKDKSKMKKNVVDYEPHLALFVKDDDPFIFYKKIAEFAQLHLKKDGLIYVEVHEEYAEMVKEIFNRHLLTSIIKQDIYGRNRMILAKR
ncbi:MAG: peptide chain release factor N(5)-glutamine methyltransferase [Ginsengibacter sp.]